MAWFGRGKQEQGPEMETTTHDGGDAEVTITRPKGVQVTRVEVTVTPPPDDKKPS